MEIIITLVIVLIGLVLYGAFMIANGITILSNDSAKPKYCPDPDLRKGKYRIERRGEEYYPQFYTQGEWHCWWEAIDFKCSVECSADTLKEAKELLQQLIKETKKQAKKRMKDREREHFYV